MVTFDQIQVGINNYFDNEIISKATGFKQFEYGFIKGAIINKVPELIDKYKDNPILKTLDIIENNSVNIDNIYGWAKDSIHNSGQFLLGGLIFNESDIDKLYGYITNRVV